MNNGKYFIAEALTEAAKLIKKYSQKYNYTARKGYLAEADIKVNEFITDIIYKKFPNSLIFSEEDGGSLSSKHQDGFYTWILDPICGTTNFIKNIPFYVHSLTVLDNTGILCAGIYDANQDELFMADRFGTTLNGQKVSTSPTKKLDEAVVSVNCNQSAWMDKGLAITNLVSKFAPPITRRVRILESANLELAYVACGRLDAYINPEDKVWDIAAGSLMIASAGGKTEILQGSISTLNSCKGIVASNKFLIKSVLNILNA